MANEDWVPKDEAGGDSSWLDTANDFGRAVTNSATFGMGNRAKAYIESWKQPATLSSLVTGAPGTYEQHLADQVQKSEQARERSPWTSTAGDVYGAFAIPALGAENLAARATAAVTPALTRIGTRVAERVAPVLGRMVGYGATGGVTGGLQGAGNTYTGNLPDYVENAAIGGVLGTALGGAGGALFGRGPAVSSARVPPAAEQRAATDMAYDALRANPAQYTPASFAQRADEATQALRRQNYYDGPAADGGSPRTFRTVEQMRSPPTAVDPVTGANTHITPNDIDIVRKGVTGDRLPPTEYGSGRIVRRNIDDFLQNPPPGAVIPGQEANAALAARQSRLAHELHGGAKRSENMEEMIRNSERTAGATHSGLNLRNELQKTIRSGLKEKAGDSAFSKAGYNPAELAEFDRFSRGQGPISNTLGYVDKYLGGGGGLGALVAGGVGGRALGGEDNNDAILKGAGVTGAGLALRLLGNRRAAADINRIRDMIAQRNPLYQQRLATAPMVPGPGMPGVAKTARDAIALELMKQTQPRIYVSPANSSDWQ